ncbi:uncharacterized protein LAESUDRAFT_759108 [Laetiporus sulphureus 93-53]|uniref:Uncharacterized protein n=1 Tax=Laetiporus sulphureus 93-53 TaxID=1314785 RepID=A0A165EAF9_9APHY|nr:uncharacterized protein LAESUDRAFT_759108 [Laetiporus sulphureus 93-53]KZT06591.1 hypothetical protein LAESUDRAFT_759108 [Laetiporus sulphureus 93-53]
MRAQDGTVVVELYDAQNATLEERNHDYSVDAVSKVSYASCQVEGIFGKVFACRIENKASFTIIVELNFEGMALSLYTVSANSTLCDMGYMISATHIQLYKFVKMFHELSTESVRSPTHGMLKFKISPADHVTYSDIDIRKDPCKRELRRRTVKRSFKDRMMHEPQVM